MLAGAVVVGSIAFLNGMASLVLLAAVSDEPRERLFDIPSK